MTKKKKKKKKERRRRRTTTTTTCAIAQVKLTDLYTDYNANRNGNASLEIVLKRQRQTHTEKHVLHVCAINQVMPCDLSKNCNIKRN